MLLRVRSRDGLERVEVPAGATVAALRERIAAQLGVAAEEQTLSARQEVLLSPAPRAFADMADPGARLDALGLAHGSIVFLAYAAGARVAAAPSAPVTPSGAFGRHMTVDDMIARQTRIERQEKPHCASVSFDRDAANAFQSYVHESLAFSVKRGGFLYGTVDDGGEVFVEFIYEPPQEGHAKELELRRDAEEERRVGIIAEGLGCRLVGFILTQSMEESRDYTMSGAEVMQVAALQAESSFEHFATAIVKLETVEDGEPEVHFEAFQLSDQCVKLYKDGFFIESPNTEPKLSKVSKEVIVAGKDVTEVDNDFFLVPVKILDHQGPLSCTFPVENRFPSPVTADIRAHLERHKRLPYQRRIADFHLLLFLSILLDPSTDVPLLTQAVRTQQPVPDGYQLMIESYGAS
eukprot:SM000352S13423  [mRNA]  locus=s352:49201:51198:+ [translate_table: standard]